MEKYAVQTTTDTTVKTANNGCPKCGSALKDTNQLICTNCGSKPFEIKEEK